MNKLLYFLYVHLHAGAPEGWGCYVKAGGFAEFFAAHAAGAA